jgi:hypothetical protein
VWRFVSSRMTWVLPTTRVKGSANPSQPREKPYGPLTRVVAFGRSYGRARTLVLLVTSPSGEDKSVHHGHASGPRNPAYGKEKHTGKPWDEAMWTTPACAQLKINFLESSDLLSSMEIGGRRPGRWPLPVGPWPLAAGETGGQLFDQGECSVGGRVSDRVGSFGHAWLACCVRSWQDGTHSCLWER